MAGVFCVSVDCINPDTLSTETVRRRADLINLLQEYRIPSNWTVSHFGEKTPQDCEFTVDVPRSATRGEMVQLLRNANARISPLGISTQSVVAEPHQVRGFWDAMVRQGCSVARPRSANSTKMIAPHVVRGGVWMVPISCSFVGGSRRSVRSLAGVCQRHLVKCGQQGLLFHLNVDIGSSRNSWPEEVEALRSLLKTSVELQRKKQLRIATLGQVPSLFGKKRVQKPQRSILKLWAA